MHKSFFLSFLLTSLFSAPLSAETTWLKSLPEALLEAQAQKKPVLIDFQAPWCYSCYYMEQHVLSKNAFAQASRRLIPVKVDVDLEEGRALKEKYGVTFLPSYVLIGADGSVLGRIIGEQTEKDFLEKLAALTGGAVSGPAARAVAALKARLDAGQYEQASQEIASLPKDLAGELSARAEWKILAARLTLMREVKAKKSVNLKALESLLNLEDSCALAYDFGYADQLLAELPEARRRELLEAARPAFEKLLENKVFNGQCADFRSGVEGLAGIYENLKLPGKKAELLARAVALLEQKKLPVGEDRNLDDNLRFFLEQAGDNAKLTALYPKLIAAYPADYVYSYRFARYLLERDLPKDALAPVELADKLCYGANRLAVTKIRAKILAALDRKDEARALLKRDIKAGAKSFPKDAAGLELLLTEISR